MSFTAEGIERTHIAYKMGFEEGKRLSREASIPSAADFLVARAAAPDRPKTIMIHPSQIAILARALAALGGPLGPDAQQIEEHIKIGGARICFSTIVVEDAAPSYEI